MFKEIFLCWIVFQLLIIGLVGANQEYNIRTGTYVCTTTTNHKQSEFIIAGLLIPLVLFVPDSQLTIDYCNKKQ